MLASVSNQPGQEGIARARCRSRPSPHRCRIVYHVVRYMNSVCCNAGKNTRAIILTENRSKKKPKTNTSTWSTRSIQRTSDNASQDPIHTTRTALFSAQAGNTAEAKSGSPSFRNPCSQSGVIARFSGREDRAATDLIGCQCLQSNPRWEQRVLLYKVLGGGSDLHYFIYF